MNASDVKLVPISSVDPTKLSPAHESRADYWLSRQFRKHMTSWAGTSEYRWKCLAMLSLHEICGWTYEMIGALFGIPRGQVSRNIRSAKEKLQDTFHGQFFDHETDAYVAVKASHAEALLEVVTAHLEACVLFNVPTPAFAPEAEVELREQLYRWDTEDE